MYRLTRSLCVALALFLGATMAQAASLDAFKSLKGELNIAGGTAHIPVMKAAAKNIMEANPDIRITVAGGGSGVGVQQVGENLVHIGNTGRPLKDAEVTKYGLKSFPFAIDGVAVVLHPSNPVSGLTRDQLKDVFAGTIANWKELGGNDAPINLYIREDGSGTREVFEEIALKKGTATTRANVVNSNGAMKTAVAQDRNAMGYVGIGHLDKSLKGLVLDGMTPSQENAAKGSYTITRLLFMNTKGDPQGLTRAFVDYIYTPEGKELSGRAGYIPLDRP